MQNYQVVKIGSNRGIPRVWLQGRQPEQAGFTPGSSFSVHVERDRKAVILRREEGGLRRVSRKEAGGKEVPVIDINSLETLSVFKGLEQVRIVTGQGVIYILPLASEARKVERIERLRQKLQRGEALKVGSLSHGGGVLDLALHRGFGAEGLQTSCRKNTDTCDITRGISMLAVVDAVVKSPLYLPPSELYTGRSCAIPCPDVVPG